MAEPYEGGLDMPKGTRGIPPCSIAGCSKPNVARGWCSAHYSRYKRWGDPLGSAPRRSVTERFWAMVDQTGDCWIWTGARFKDGYPYGMFRTTGSRTTSRLVQAHRFAYRLVHGSIPAGMCVLHHCDNPPCVRPSHLFLGTQGDNMRDMVAKGRGSGRR